MSGFKVSIDGPGKILGKLNQIQNVVFVVAAEELAEGAMSVHRHAVISIQAHESVEKVERRYSPNRDAEVSAPGNPPNKDLGTLAQSISFEVDRQALTAVVGTNLLYGKYLELGTTKMLPRPWLLPAFEAHRDEIAANMAERVGQKLKELG